MKLSERIMRLGDTPLPLGVQIELGEIYAGVCALEARTPSEQVEVTEAVVARVKKRLHPSMPDDECCEVRVGDLRALAAFADCDNLRCLLQTSRDLVDKSLISKDAYFVRMKGALAPFADLHKVEPCSDCEAAAANQPTEGEG